MSDFIDGLERDLVEAARRQGEARRTAAAVRRRRLPGRGLAVAVAALVVAGSATAAAVKLTAQPSKPLAGAVDATHRYVVSLGLDLRAGHAGWCGSIRYSTAGRSRFAATGCGPPRAAGGSSIAGGAVGVGQTIQFLVVTARVRAVSFRDGRLVATRPDTTLPYGWRYAVASQKPLSAKRRFVAPAPAVLLDEDGNELRAATHADQPYRAARSRAVTKSDPARRCVIGGADGYRAGYARVALGMPRLPRRIAGRAFASCAYTVFHTVAERSHLTATILLDAQRPSARAAALPPVPGLSGRRLGRGWLVVSGGDAEQRARLLARLTPRL